LPDTPHSTAGDCVKGTCTTRRPPQAISSGAGSRYHHPSSQHKRLRLACAKLGRPPPPPPHSLARVPTSLPALRPALTAAGLAATAMATLPAAGDVARKTADGFPSSPCSLAAASCGRRVWACDKTARLHWEQCTTQQDLQRRTTWCTTGILQGGQDENGA